MNSAITHNFQHFQIYGTMYIYKAHHLKYGRTNMLSITHFGEKKKHSVAKIADPLSILSQ